MKHPGGPVGRAGGCLGVARYKVQCQKPGWQGFFLLGGLFEPEGGGLQTGGFVVYCGTGGPGFLAGCLIFKGPKFF